MRRAALGRKPPVLAILPRSVTTGFDAGTQPSNARAVRVPRTLLTSRGGGLRAAAAGTPLSDDGSGCPLPIGRSRQSASSWRARRCWNCGCSRSSLPRARRSTRRSRSRRDRPSQHRAPSPHAHPPSMRQPVRWSFCAALQRDPHRSPGDHLAHEPPHPLVERAVPERSDSLHPPTTCEQKGLSRTEKHNRRRVCAVMPDTAANATGAS